MIPEHLRKLLEQETTKDDSLASLVVIAAELHEARKKVELLELKRKDLIIIALDNGASQYEVADHANISRTRIKQIALSPRDNPLQKMLEEYQAALEAERAQSDQDIKTASPLEQESEH